MNKRLQLLGIGLVVMGLVFFAAGGYTLYKTQQGANALQTFSAAQNVTLNYNDQGQLVDRGETAGADKIMGLLVNDWGYAVDKCELNPNDPLVNTASEYMYQMATISYHTLHGDDDGHVPRGRRGRRHRSSRQPARTTSRTTASIGPASTGPTRSRVRPARRSGPAPRRR